MRETDWGHPAFGVSPGRFGAFVAVTWKQTGEKPTGDTQSSRADRERTESRLKVLYVPSRSSCLQPYYETETGLLLHSLFHQNVYFVGDRGVNRNLVPPFLVIVLDELSAEGIHMFAAKDDEMVETFLLDRLHSSLGYLTPSEFARRSAASAPAVQRRPSSLNPSLTQPFMTSGTENWGTPRSHLQFQPKFKHRKLPEPPKLLR